MTGPAGRVVVVTGAAGPAGTATTRALQSADATVIAVGRSPERLAALAEAIPGINTEVTDRWPPGSSGYGRWTSRRATAPGSHSTSDGSRHERPDPVSTLHDPDSRGFASDNYAGAHPEILAALAQANGGHQISYGEDVYTARLQDVMAQHLGPDVEVFPVFNGTGANVLSLQSMLPRWGGVICAETAHINTDENGAPERVGGIKLLTVPTPDGKLTPELIDRQSHGRGDEHRAQPLAVSITQTTELGTAYTAEEIRAIADHIHPLGMQLHLDGARLANAAATLDLPLRAFTTDAGVDVLSFGGTKNGLLFGEAIVVLRPDVCDGLIYLRKMNMQLASKMRFVSAQLIALLEGDLWIRSARHANAMAARLAAAVRDLPGVTITQPAQANAVFAIVDPAVADRLRQKFRFYDWNPATGEVRWMCAFDTTPADVDTFAGALAEELHR